MLNVFAIQDVKQEGKDRKSFWTKVGSAFANKDGSINVYLNALPINGKLQIREANKDGEGQ